MKRNFDKDDMQTNLSLAIESFYSLFWASEFPFLFNEKLRFSSEY
jgi:hypothetical protein